MSVFKIIKNEVKDLLELHKFFVFILIIIAVCGGFIPFFSIILTRFVIDAIFNDGINLINAIVILCAIACFFVVVYTYLSGITDIWFSHCRMTRFNFINRFYSEIDYEYIEDSNFKDEFNIATTALNGDNLGYEDVLKKIVTISPLIITLIIYTFVIGKFNLLILLSCFINAIIFIFVRKKIAQYIDSHKKERSKYNRQLNYFNSVSYDFKNGKDIRVYSLQDKIIDDYHKKSDKMINIVKDEESYSYKYGLIELLFIFLQNLLAYYFVIKSYKNGLITIGQVTMYIGLIISFSDTMKKLTDNVGGLIRSSKYCETYYEFFNKNYKSIRGTHKKNDDTLEIEFKNVSFKYRNSDRYILKNFNFKIHKNEKLAIVGVNGAGKSTIIKLISGLYFPNEGEILINGISTKDYAKKDLESMFSVVYQDIVIVPGTILENIDGENTDINKAKQVLNKVGLEEKINSFEHKYDTQLLKAIYDDGVELSGGENQKLAIARALYKDGNCIILDEPTSALDALKEAEIYQSFNDLVKNKTSIYISHRLSSTKFCDRIALFDKNGLVEEGSHEYLMNLKGKYYSMFMTQGKYYQDGGKE